MSGPDQNMEDERLWEKRTTPYYYGQVVDEDEVLHLQRRDGEAGDQLAVQLVRAPEIRVQLVELTCGHSSNKPTPTMMKTTHGLVRLHWCAWCGLARMASVRGVPLPRKVEVEDPLEFIDRAFDRLSD